MTVTELDERMDTLRGQIRTAKNELLTMTGDASAKMEDIRAKKQALSDLQERLSTMEEQKAQMAGERRQEKKPQMTMKEARGAYYKAVLNDGEGAGAAAETYAQLGGIPAESVEQGHGSRLLPKQLANDLILAPEVKNPLRDHMVVTAITGLELPKLLFDLADDAYMAKDGETAKELAMDADNVAFGRHKMHIIAHVSESLLRSTPVNIEAAVDGALQSALAAKELKVMFATTPVSGEEDMSFYTKVSGVSVIKEVTGATMLDAILAAYADLEDAYRMNAKVCMRYADYAAMLRTLAGGDNLFGKKPEDILGIEAIFCDKAVTPVVGDFQYVQENFDTAPWFDTDKDLTKGNRLFDCTALYDIKRRMNAAFRLAKTST